MGQSTSRLLGFVIIPVLVVAALLLPPISLPTRISEIGYARLERDGGTVRAVDGAAVAVPAGATSGNIPIKLDVIPGADFQKQTAGDSKAAAAAFSSNLEILSPVYAIDTRGNSVAQAAVSIPIPAGVDKDALRLVDAYGWDGTVWRWVPSRPIVEDSVVVAAASPLPQALALVRAPAVAKPVVSAWLPAAGSIDEGAKAAVAVLNPVGLALNTDGSIMGELTAAQDAKVGGYLIVPTLQNKVGDGFDQDLVANILQNASLRGALVQNISKLVAAKSYDGVDLDIRGLSEASRAAYAGFVAEMAADLHKNGKRVSVTLPEPVQVSDDAWRTDGYDWVALGRAADSVKISVDASPADFLVRSEKVLAYAVSQIQRNKVQLVLPTYSQVMVDQDLVETSFSDVINTVTKLSVGAGTSVSALTSEAVTVSLQNLAAAPAWDDAAKATRVTYREGNAVRTAWLETGTSFAHKLRRALDYGIGGVAVRDLLGNGNNPEIWEVVSIYSQSAQVTAAAPVDGSVKLAWNASGGQVQPSSGSDSWSSIIWKAPEKAGSYTVTASIAGGSVSGAMLPAGSVSIAVLVPTPTPTPVPPTPTPKPVAPAAPAPAAAPAPQPVANPGFGYGVQAHMLGNDKPAVANAITGMGFNWLKQQVEWRDIENSKGSFNWGGLDDVVNVSNSKGIRVMFSVLRSPGWASGHADSPPRNFNDYGDFVGALAARYKGKGMAYEVWNEQNLKREWHDYPIDACKYVELLKIAYTRIKAADPSAIVVAGALTPTGVNDPNIAVDDRTYLQSMYSCGIRGWFDALGAHPSGFNNPPDADWRTWSDPARPSFKGHPSFFFKATMEDYRNIMVANGDGGRPIWVTEFGWAVGASIPGYEYAPQNSESERAAWFVKAYRMSKSWGFVGVVFLWNLDFRIVAPGSEQALFGIVNGGFAPTDTYVALRDMPK